MNRFLSRPIRGHRDFFIDGRNLFRRFLWVFAQRTTLVRQTSADKYELQGSGSNKN